MGGGIQFPPLFLDYYFLQGVRRRGRGSERAINHRLTREKGAAGMAAGGGRPQDPPPTAPPPTPCSSPQPHCRPTAPLCARRYRVSADPRRQEEMEVLFMAGAAIRLPLLFRGLCFVLLYLFIIAFFSFLFFFQPGLPRFPFPSGLGMPEVPTRSSSPVPRRVPPRGVGCTALPGGEFGPKVKGEGAAIGLSHGRPPLYAVYSLVNN